MNMENNPQDTQWEIAFDEYAAKIGILSREEIVAFIRQTLASERTRLATAVEELRHALPTKDHSGNLWWGRDKALDDVLALIRNSPNK